MELGLRDKLFRYVAYEEALRRALESVRLLEAEEVPLLGSVGRVLAEDVRASRDVPPRLISLVDGYAISSEDTAGASASTPVRLRASRSVYIGEEPGSLSRGEAIYVATDAYLPEGADAVVPVEAVRQEGDFVELRAPVSPGSYVLPAGGDVSAGQVILEAGRIVAPQDLELLAESGILKLRVRRKPIVALIPVGSELSYTREGGKKLEIRHAIVSEALRRHGAKAIAMPIAPDDPSKIREIVQKALDEADVVVTIGGTSVGRRDYVWATLKAMSEFEPMFRGLRLKPGRVTSMARVRGKPVVLLAGHFQSMIVGLIYVLLPMVRHMIGLEPDVRRVVARGRLSEDVGGSKFKKFRRIVFVRVEEGRVVPLRGPSFCRAPVARSHGFVEVPEGVELLRAGEEVNVLAAYGLWG